MTPIPSVIKVFLSYARNDTEIALRLRDDIRSLGFDVWIDKELTGGQVWWNEILSRIRECDVFVLSVSDSSVNSLACMREMAYAESLGKTVIPALISFTLSVNTLVPGLAEKQLVEYHGEERESALRLARALNRSKSSSPLPSHLPDPPPAPLSYFSQIARALQAESLSPQEQSQILLDIKDKLNGDPKNQDALTMLRRLSERHDVYVRVANEIDRILATADITSSREEAGKNLSRKTSSPSLNLNITTTPSLAHSARVQFGVAIAVAWMWPAINWFSIPVLIIILYLSKPRPNIGFPLVPWCIWMFLVVLSIYSGSMWNPRDGSLSGMPAVGYIYLVSSIVSGVFVGYRFMQANAHDR